MSEPAATTEFWAIVEIYGHTKIAGLVTEQVIAGQGFIRVDVPDLPAAGPYRAQEKFTRLYGANAIYSITPVSEEIALQAAQSMRVKPVNVYVAPLLTERIQEDDNDDYDDELDYDT